MLSRAHASTPTLDSQVRSVLTLCDITYSRRTSSASSQLFDRRMLSLSFRLPRSEVSVVHPFRPSFHVPSSPSIQRTDARARGSLLVIAISGSMRLHSLVTAITGSVRPSHVGGTARHRHLRVGAASLAPSARRGVPLTAFARTHRHSDARFMFCFSCFCFVCLFVPTHGPSDSRSDTRPRLFRQTVPHPRISHGMQQHIPLSTSPPAANTDAVCALTPLFSNPGR